MSRGRVFGSIVGLATIVGTIFSGVAAYMYAADNSWLDHVPQWRVASKIVKTPPPPPVTKTLPQRTKLRPALRVKARKPKRIKRRVASKNTSRTRSTRRTVSIFHVGKDIPHPTSSR